MKRIIEYTADGSATLYVPELDEHYHSVKGAYTESGHIFINLGLKASVADAPKVLEVGFGSGLNALLTLEEAMMTQRKVSYVGVELYPLLWEEVSLLGYSGKSIFEQLHRAPWEETVNISSWFTLKKVQIDIMTFLQKTEERFDVVYYDAFSPEKQPDMWTESLFRLLYGVMNEGGVLTTYCAKGVVRRLFEQVGFRVERLPGPPCGKREVLRATKVSG